MGSISSEPMASLVRHLAKTYQIADFVETGTFKGDSSLFAAQIFPSVTTIEINPQYRDFARTRLPASVRSLLGDSRAVLPQVVAELGGPALFWLDGHAGGGHFGSHEDCPLIAELTAVSRSPHEHFIFVDDARAFLAPPPPPFDAKLWPTLREVLDAACQTTPYFCIAILDALICVPEKARADLTRFCNQIRPRI